MCVVWLGALCILKYSNMADAANVASAKKSSFSKIGRLPGYGSEGVALPCSFERKSGKMSGGPVESREHIAANRLNKRKATALQWVWILPGTAQGKECD